MSDSPEVRELLEESTDEEQQRREENYHQEIDDIVKGFILEKDILKQGHDDELAHMKEQFRKERSSLMKQFEKERQEMLRNTSQENLASETRYTSSSADSALGYSYSHNHSASDAVFESQWEQLSPSTRRVIKEPEAMDLNVIREIAEVYLRMQNGLVTSSVRPDLDLEDKFEREREVLEQSFAVEKRELRRKLEEDFNRKMEQERNRYECTIQDQKTMISDLQWQKRELENRLRHGCEKIEIQFEREKNEIEKHRMQDMQDLQRKIETKYSAEMAKQRDKYEENIDELQGDITRLTMQLRELNENLKQEKEIIVTKFEREIKEMEITFTEQRASIQMSLESEFAIKLENETTLLRSINSKLKDDLESLEKDKRDMERRLKEERRRLEEQYEDEISEMGRKYADDRKSIKARTEERYHQLLIKERGPMEENIIELQGQISILRHENAHLEAALNDRTEEMRKQIDFEREEVRRKLYSDREEIRARIESEFSQKLIIETTSLQEIAKNQEIELSTLRSRCVELEGRLTLFAQEKDTLMREREHIENNIRMREMELNSRQELLMSQRNSSNKDELDEIIRKKDGEISILTLEKERLEINVSALKREKMDFEDEIVALKRAQNLTTRSSSSERPDKSSRNALDNSELVSLQETIRNNEQEMHSLKRDKYDFESRLSSMQRKIEELEDELLTLRRKKLEVEDEISALKRDKTETDDQLTGMRREKNDLEEQLASLKRKLNESEDQVSAFKRGKMELDHEIAMLKRYKNDTQRETSVTEHGQHATKDVRFDDTHHVRHEDHVNGSRQGWEAEELEEKIIRLIGEKQDLEKEIHMLRREKTEVERNLRSRLEHQQESLQEPATKRREQDDGKRQKQGEKVRRSDFEQQTHELEYKNKSLEEEQMELQHKKSLLRRDLVGLEEQVSSLDREKDDLEKAVIPLRFEKRDLEKTIESLQKEKKNFENRRVETRLSQDDFHTESKDDPITRVRQERDDLKIELLSIKKQFLQLQSEISQKSVHISKESVRIEGKEIVEMKRDRMELEKVVAALRSQKTELETEITVIREVKKREETNKTTLRKEKMELDMLLTELQSQKTRLQAETSVIRETRKREENDINSLRKEKNDIEKELYALQSQKWKLETDISVADDSWRKKESAITGLSTDIVGVEDQLTILRKQKSELQHEISKIQSAKNREKKELIIIRQEKGTYKGSLDVCEDQEQLDVLRKQREDLQVEITTIQRDRKREEKELALIQNEKFEIESTLLSLRKEIDNCDSFSTDFPSASTPRFHLSQVDSGSRSCNSKCETPSRYYSSDHDTLSRIGLSFSNESSPRLSSALLNSSSRTHTSNSKENNELKCLSDEKVQLQTQICELRVQLSRLQTEVTDLENKKTVLVSVHGRHSESVLANGTGSTSLNGVHNHRGSEDALREDLKEELSKAIMEVSFILLPANSCTKTSKARQI